MIIESRRWRILWLWAFFLAHVELDTDAISQALTSSEVLEYDPASGALVEGVLYRTLRELLSAVKKFNLFHRSKVTEPLLKIIPDQTQTHLEIEVKNVISMIGFMDRVIDVTELAKGVHSLLEGRVANIKRRPQSPIVGMDAELEKEEVTDQMLKIFLALP